MIAATPAEREREQIRTLRTELRPLGVRVHVETRHGHRRYRVTAGDRELFNTRDKLSVLAFGAGMMAGHQQANTQAGAKHD